MCEEGRYIIWFSLRKEGQDVRSDNKIKIKQAER
jgi:hypothetical protein